MLSTRRTWVIVGIILLLTGSIGTVPAHGAIRTPAVGSQWQWILSRALTSADLQLDVPTFDIDGFENSSSTVGALHASGKYAICYIEVGGWENYRPDAARYPDSVLGKAIDGWAGERWVDIRNPVIQPILRARFQMCKAKGFDAVEPDLMEGFSNDTGFRITYPDQLRFNLWVASEVHSLGMGVAQKNTVEMVADLASVYDFALVEQCVQYSECRGYMPYINLGKAVLSVEYRTTTAFCASLPQGFSGMAKKVTLNSWRLPCP